MARRRPRITRFEASRRSKKAWETRRRRYPSQHGEIISAKGKTYWNRPEEMIRLKRFSEKDLTKIQPALAAADRTLKPGTELGLKNIRKSRRPLRGRSASYHSPVIAEWGHRQAILARPSINMNKTLFRPGLRKNPAGLLSHEIGHAVFPGLSYKKPRHAYYDYQKAFNYKKKVGKHVEEVDKYKPTRRNPIRKKKTRQGKDAAEDFAETYRTMTGLPVSRRRYWSDVQITPERVAYMRKYHIK